MYVILSSIANYVRGRTGVASALALVAAALNVAAAVDQNTNGMSDVWEAAYNAQAVSATADSDGDGQSNFQESVAGTDPFDSNSVFRVQFLNFLPDASLVRWDSVAGVRYQVEGNASLSGGTWLSAGDPVIGTGQPVLAAAPAAAPPFLLFRLRVIVDNPAITNSMVALSGLDTDGDGFLDLDEFAAGTDMFDAGSKLQISSAVSGRCVVLKWPTVLGKTYQLESAASLNSAAWQPEDALVAGTGSLVTVAVEAGDGQRVFRVRVGDGDSDLDGITDWEERLANLDQAPINYRIHHPTPTSAVLAKLAATNVVNLELEAPVANITRLTSGGFRVTRSGNLNRLAVQYTIGGDAAAGIDYVPVSGTVDIPAGVDSVEVPVVPLALSPVALSRAVTLTLQPGAGFQLGSNTTVTVNVVREVALSVADYGAVGDGGADDTAAIQSAITALEQSTNHNTLHFPAGIYRLNTPTYASIPNLTWYHAVKLGGADLAGRDLFFTGAPGAVLYSTIHHVRSHMIHASASFRTLSFHGLTWRKESVPLPEISGREPNFASGVDLLNKDQRRVEAVGFWDCTFDNCHGAVSAGANGFDLRGRLARFDFRNCTVLNPFGSNTTNAWTAMGGGQQVRLNPWVGFAYYEGNYFEGVTNGPVDYTKNPGGDRKDGSHFGSPLRLVFTNNIVRRMEIEAVHQYDDPFMANTSTVLVIPPADGTPVQHQVFQVPSTFAPGQVLNYRTWFHSTAVATNIFFKVVAYDAANRMLTITNLGLTPNVVGLTMPTWQPIFLQDYNPTVVTVVNNLIDGGESVGFIGITSNARTTIQGNAILGYQYGVYFYENPRNPISPPTARSFISSNVIYTHNSLGGTPWAFGIVSYGPGEIVANNLVVTPNTYRFVGVVSRDDSAWLEANAVIPVNIQYHSYNSIVRSVGIAFGNGTTNGTAVGNRTSGMDVGVGPENPYQIAPHRVISHFSTNDVLSIDPVGLIP